MHTLATATLLQGPQRQRACVIRLIALGDGTDPDARDFVASRSVTELAQAGTVRSATESTLTPLPLTLSAATAKAVDFVRHRVAMGDLLQTQSGFSALLDLAPDASMGGLPLQNDTTTADTPNPVASSAPAPATATPQVASAQPEPSFIHTPSPATPTPEPAHWQFPQPPAWVARRKPANGESAAIARLIAQLAPANWRLLPSPKRARVVWRLAERFDTGRAAQPDQQRLYRQVPALVGLLESGDDLLDYCLAWALGRLNDPGSTQALAALARHGRSAATRQLAEFAHLQLQVRHDPAQARAQLAPIAALRPQLLTQLGELAAQAAENVQPVPDAPVRVAAATALLQAHQLAQTDATVHAALCEALGHLRFAPDVFGAVRQLYKLAEFAQDWPLLATLHARFEHDGAHGADTRQGTHRNPRTGLPMTDAARMAPTTPLSLYQAATRDYFRARGVRTVRRLAQMGHSQAPNAAVALLGAMPTGPVRHGTRHPESVLAQAHGWAAAGELLLHGQPEWRLTNHRVRQPAYYPDWRDDRLPDARVDGPAPLWDQHPQAVLQLLRTSGNRLVQWVMARVMRDHMPWLAELPPPPISDLLASRFAHTAALGLEVAAAHLARLRTPAERLPWWLALARSPHPQAATLLAQSIGTQTAHIAQSPALLAALLYSPNASNRALGYSVSPLHFTAQTPNTANVMNEVLARLPALDDDHAEAAAIAQGLQQWLAGDWARCADQVPAAPLLALLNDPALPVLQVASAWVLLHPAAMAQLPPATLQALLTSNEPARRVCGVRLLASLPHTALREHVDVLFDYSQSPDAAMRAAVWPAITRLADGGNDTRAACEHLAQRLHASLFRTEPFDGVHTDTLALLAGPLAAMAPAQDAASTWRALQAQSRGAQQYGALSLSKVDDATYTLRQWATLGRHADVSVRERAMATIDRVLTPMAATTPSQADALLPLADSAFENSQRHARSLFGERLPDTALPPELLIRWVDHPQAWV